MGCCKTKLDEKESEDQEVVEAKTLERDKGFSGPIDRRHCRDIIWFIIFILFCAGMLAIASISFDQGQPKMLLYGVDSWGNICGENVTTNKKIINDSNSGLDMTDRKYLYYADPEDFKAARLCVPACPTIKNSTSGDGTTFDCTANITACRDELSICVSSLPYTVHAASAESVATSATDSANSGCPEVAYDSVNLLGLRRCVPDKSVDTQIVALAEKIYDDINNIEILQEIFSDFAHVGIRFIWLFLICIGISFVLIVFMRCFTAPLIYTCLIIGIGACGALTYYFYKEWREAKDILDQYPVDQQYDEDIRNERFFMGFFIASAVFTGIIFLIVLVLRNRIRLTVALFEEASKAALRMPQLYLSPLWTYMFVLTFVAYWIYVYLFLSTMGEATMDPVTFHARYEDTNEAKAMWWYHLFGLLWILQFILACEEICLAGAISAWYFTRDKGQLSWPYFKAVGRLIRYSLGSAAFGSFIIAVIQLARIILAYIQKKLKGKVGIVAEFFLKCLACCLWCFEKFMKFLNKNAYIEIAIYGYSFCTAARQAFNLLFRNILRVAVIQGVGGFVLFVMKLLVIAGTGLCAVLWLREDDDIHYLAVVVFMICVVAWFIADVFISIYDMTIDTLFLCFAEDCERNNGKDKPYFMSSNLLKFMKSGAANKPAEAK